MAKKTHKARYWAVVPAAGIGSRMQSTVPKLYHPLRDRPILEHTISVLVAHTLIEQVIVVLHPRDEHWPTIHLACPEKVSTTIGGPRRLDSVMKGLQHLETQAASHDWVLVHDAARPCLSAALLDHFIQTLSSHVVGGLLALPIVDTIKQVSNTTVLQTVPRERLWTAQTPQMFRYGLLCQALKQALPDSEDITDESSAIEQLGHQPAIVRGDRRNIKITHPEDLSHAESVMGNKE